MISYHYEKPKSRRKNKKIYKSHNKVVIVQKTHDLIAVHGRIKLGCSRLSDEEEHEVKDQPDNDDSAYHPRHSAKESVHRIHYRGITYEARL